MPDSSSQQTRKHDPTCVFCQIMDQPKKEKLLLNEQEYIAFLDIRPYSLGHTLVIPKTHYRWVWDIPDVGEILEVGKRIANAIQKAFSPALITAGIVGEEIPHAHLHIIPRYERPIKSYSKEEVIALIQKYL